MTRQASRRQFLQHAVATGAGAWVAGRTALAESSSANETLNIAFIGAGGRGNSNLRAISRDKTVNVVALCDVDEKEAAESFQKFPRAKKYHDFRVMLERQKKIDAVVVSTPDHTHAVASIMAMKMGKHCYCEKPLTHDIYEARQMREVAAQHMVATQMGNQGTAQDGLRTAVEVIRSGAIGPVREVHVWTNRPDWPQGAHLTRPTETPPVPKTLNWDLWLGPAPERPYHPVYVPADWRAWWDFGTGALGDMACHTGNMAFMALKLGWPISLEAESAENNGESYPTWSTIRYEFSARGDMPPVKWTWYDGVKEGERNLPPAELLHGKEMPSSGSLLVGDKGSLFSPNDYDAEFVLLPEKDFEGYEPPEPWLPRSPGHHAEFIRACKGGEPAMSNFSYAAVLTETVLLGNVAVAAGKRIDWDGPNMRVTNDTAVNHFVRREYREGWTL